MKSVDDLLRALPIRGIKVRAGSYGNCGGVIWATVDLEPGHTDGVEVIGTEAELPDWFEDFPDELQECVDNIANGARTEFRDRFGTEPAVRLVLRRVMYNPVDIIMVIGRSAGKRVVTQAIKLTTLRAGLEPHDETEPVPSDEDVQSSYEPIDQGRWRAKLWEQRLRAPIGLTDTGSPLELDLKDHFHNGIGPHGMLIGAPGSGMPEALRAIVTSLARSHTPEELNLMLVDFDDGDGFDRFGRLLHTRFVVKDLRGQPSLLDWLEHAIVTELDYRRRLLNEADGVDTHSQYERARQSGDPLTPLPSLLVVVNGFSDLIGAAPDFLSTLIHIGRLGRKLGVHLLVATQHLAEARVRGLDGFLSYRIAMRTDTATESRGVIGVPDAYDLPDAPGHAYLKVGTDALIRFQFGRIRQPYPFGD
ncbi:FtsK/SpoIIIE domain-containing protein [Stackebrandtia nassauensis]|uniref:FtsK/SpoIIIE domain-containing protein n=1 Tax=Stackebrandtia nassauensis TaxID=283811 RepID=UPI0001A3A9A0|nr:FtsK/SpoIIIE domain-containing protein [Stackebrandtia nassauensis]